jgi:FdhD protein
MKARVPSRMWRAGREGEGSREVPEETPVALVYDAATEAVMMATPADLEDFAYGFSLNEGLIETLDEVQRLDIVPGEHGIEARLWIKPDRGRAISARRRLRVGPTGCGLCGVESLEDAIRLRGRVEAHLRLPPADVMAALKALHGRQPLGHATRAVHAAGFWAPGDGMVAVREDVGRHNALDKLAGALARQGIDPRRGAVVLTSRVSVEMVQKAVAMGAPVLIAISAPTALALRTAEAAGLTVVAVAREDGFEVFTRPERIAELAAAGR